MEIPDVSAVVGSGFPNARRWFPTVHFRQLVTSFEAGIVVNIYSIYSPTTFHVLFIILLLLSISPLSARNIPDKVVKNFHFTDILEFNASPKHPTFQFKYSIPDADGHHSPTGGGKPPRRGLASSPPCVPSCSATLGLLRPILCSSETRTVQHRS